MAAEKRLKIADSILLASPDHPQALHAKLQALVDLHDYKAADEMLKGGAASFVHEKWPGIVRRLLLESCGRFDLSDYILGLRGAGAPESAPFLRTGENHKAPDFAQFVSDAVVIRTADMKVVGLFARGRCICRGELILVDHSIGPVMVGERGVEQLVRDTLAEAIQHVQSSSMPDLLSKGPPLAPPIDVPNTDDLKLHEAANVPMKVMCSTVLELDSAGRHPLALVDKAGCWTLLSFINHSCDPNAAYFVIGNALFLKAVHDIPDGEQIFVTHCNAAMPMAKRHLSIGFECNCARCQFETKLLKLSKKLRRASRQWFEAEPRLGDGSHPGTKAASIFAITKRVEAAAARMINPQHQMWLRTSFFGAYKLGLYPLELNEAIDTHRYSSTAGDVLVLRSLFVRDYEGRFRSELLTAAALCFPPCSQEALLELLTVLRGPDRYDEAVRFTNLSSWMVN